MRNLRLFAMLVVAGLLGCTETESARPLPTQDGTAGPDGAAPPPPGPSVPALGVQLDRHGRAAINLALNHAFDLDGEAAGQAWDGYNAAAADQWASFAPELAKNLAIYDGLDGQCGNQLLVGKQVAEGRYGELSAVLADDALYLNTEASACGQYLAVEANALGMVNEDCGGRAPDYDAIDTTYSVLVTGRFRNLTDGVPADADGKAASSFPFLLPPTR